MANLKIKLALELLEVGNQSVVFETAVKITGIDLSGKIQICI